MNDDNNNIHSPWFLRFLMLTAVLCGGFVMVVEVMGSRIIGPFFGVGLFVWTSLIAVALLSLALGYWIAGYWADKREHPDNLYGIILVSGLLVMLIPFIKTAVIELCIPLGLRWGAFASTFLLFGPPLFVLGCVSPYLIKIATKEFHLIGRTVGRFYALSTLGSMVGTTATGFFLISYFRVDTVFMLTAAVLIGMSVTYFVLFRKRYIMLLLMLLPVIFWPTYKPIDVVLSDGTRVQEVANLSSYYGLTKVVDYTYEDKHVRDLLIDGFTQGGFDMVNRVSLYEYSYLLEFIPYGLNPNGSQALVIGLGAGVVPMRYEARGVSVDAVDIDPVIVDVAKEFFDLKVSGEIYVDDARYFLTTNQKRYDYVIMDVFNGDLTPTLLLSYEAFGLIKKSLTDEGVFAINLVADIQNETAGIHSILKTLRPLFEHVDYYPIHKKNKNNITNVVVVAYNGVARELNNGVFAGSRIYPPIRERVINSILSPKKIAAPQRPPIVLTDDFNPLDTWDSGTREGLRALVLASDDLGLLRN